MEVAREYGEVVATPAEADVALLLLETPFQPARTGVLFAIFFHSTGKPLPGV